LKVLVKNIKVKGRVKAMSSTMGQTGFGTGQMGQSGQQMQAQQHTEGTVARTIEQQTAKLPSDTFLWAAIGSIGASAILRLMGKKHASLFVGDWVAPLMLFGVYNKIVKTQGSDRLSRGN
jgi:hypothetical protein